MSLATSKVFSPLQHTIAESEQGTAYQSLTSPATPLAVSAPKAYIETYGCQMNFSDTEIVAAMLTDMGYGFTREDAEADLILINTCSIRENAESKVWNRLVHLKSLKKKNPKLMVGILGCMAERLKKSLLDENQLVDLVVGPDAYRSLPNLLAEVESGQRAVNVLLSREETYADISPIRLNTNGVTAFISITRGCNNMCSFCVVPFTRGRERSREADSIVREAQELVDNGYREVTLLGQNVDSYHHEGVSFAQLLAKVAQVDPNLRVRFSTSHPKDITDEVIYTMAEYDNICNYIHLPVQSGSSKVLELMNRGYTRERYLSIIERIRVVMPNCGLSTDIIAGFCSETDEDHQQTLSLMQEVGYDSAFMFFYSERPGTPAAKKLVDDVPEELKKARLKDIIDLQYSIGQAKNQADIGQVYRVLIEGDSKKSSDSYCGRNDANKMINFPKLATAYSPGDYVFVRVTEATSATLKGELV
jgi:tRNA-2-methylthio-N6-dimethylallyladenosine synthase